jgi:hypothetical protein
MVLLGEGGNSKRLEEGSEVIGGVPLKKKVGPQSLPLSLCFPAAMRQTDFCHMLPTMMFVLPETSKKFGQVTMD